MEGLGQISSKQTVPEGGPGQKELGEFEGNLYSICAPLRSHTTEIECMYSNRSSCIAI